MAGTNYILVFLVIVLALFIIVFAIMFIGMRRSNRQPGHPNEPVVGRDNMKSETDMNRLKYRGTEGAMDEDVGGNLRKVPQEAREQRREGNLQ